MHDGTAKTSISSTKDTIVTGFIDLIAGSLGGCANVLVGQPLDTVKVKMQAYPTIYGSALKCFKTTLVQDGVVRGLYAGTLPALAANVAENSVLFAAYGYCQNQLTKHELPLMTKMQTNESCHKESLEKSRKNVLTPLGNATAGFMAAFFSSFTLCPTELIKCKLQALRESGATDANLTAYKLTKNILRNEGVPGLFRGLTSTMAREMPGYFFFFGGYELSKQFFTANGAEMSATTTVISGGIGGVCLWTAIFPFDVAKSQIQINSLRQSMWSVIFRIYRAHGIQALYNGLLPTVLRTFPSTGALFVAYEYSKLLMTNVSTGCGLLS